MRAAHAVRGLFLLLLVVGCQKGDFQNTPNDPPPAEPVRAVIILPEGSTLVSKQLKVTNGLFESYVSDNAFEIDTTSLQKTFSFVTDELHQPYLIKYYDPSSSDLQISPYTTALALVMASPIVTGLNDEGRQNLISSVTVTAEFTALEDEIKESLRQARPLTDTTNTSLSNALLAVYDKIVTVTPASGIPNPVLIATNGRTISLTNNGASNSYVAGVYKDGERVGNFTLLRGTPRVASSTNDLISGIFNPFTSPDMQSIDLTGDGRFEIRVRSGNLSAQDASQENHLAAKINLINIAWKIAGALLPSNVTCLNEVENDVITSYEIDVPVLTGSLNEISTTVYHLAQQIIADNIGSTSVCYENEDIFSNYRETIKLFTNYLGSVPNVNGTGMNVTPQLFHLYYNQPSYDLCYTADGNNIADCDAPSVDSFTYQAYFAIPGTSTGGPIEFNLHFSGRNITGTGTSTAFDFGSGVQTVPVTGTIDGSSMQLLIHVDNGIAPALIDCIPQTAPLCESCAYTGDNVVQDWVITGTVNDDHSSYNADFTRKFTYTSLVVQGDCSTTTVVEQDEENGVLAY